MKRLNNKGYMLVEIILASVIAFGVAYFMLDLTIKMRNKNDDMVVSSLVTTDQTVTSKKLMDYILDEDNGKAKFDCDKLVIEGNVIKYGEDVIDIVDEYAKVGEKYCINNKGRITINIPLVVKQQKNKNFDIVVDYRYKFNEISYLIPVKDSTSNFITTANASISKDKINSITFMSSYEAPVKETRELVGKFDVSEKQNETIMAYYYESSVSGSYDFYIGSVNDVVYANPNSRYVFAGMTNLVSINCMEYFDTSKVTTMERMFYSCNDLTTLDVSNFNTSNVIMMEYMFYNCGKLATLDVSHFNTSKVTNMKGMFRHCNSLTTINVDNFDTSNVTNMSSMFGECFKLTTLNVSHFDTSKVTDMSSLFYQCSSLTVLDISNFNTSNVINMSYMFVECKKLATLDVSHFDTSKVTDMRLMFYNCQSLTTLDMSNFDTSKVTNMSYMFYQCKGLTILDLSNFDTAVVTDMSYMFLVCSKLTLLNIKGFTFNNITDEGKRDMFSYFPKSCDIIVGSQEAKEWIKNNFDIDTRIQ